MYSYHILHCVPANHSICMHQTPNSQNVCIGQLSSPSWNKFSIANCFHASIAHFLINQFIICFVSITWVCWNSILATSQYHSFLNEPYHACAEVILFYLCYWSAYRFQYQHGLGQFGQCSKDYWSDRKGRNAWIIPQNIYSWVCS